MSSFNDRMIAEFRANQGRIISGPFAGLPMALVHHVGRRSGNTHVNPMTYLSLEDDVLHVFATKAGAPTNPDWYYNLVAAGAAVVEVGSEQYLVDVAEEVGTDRDRIYAEQASRYPGFAEYAEKLAGIRTIPVLRLTRTV